MDKEKEIEEMAHAIGRKNFLCAENCNECIQTREKCRLIKHATTLVNAGYGHIPTALNAYLHSNVKAAAMIDSIVAIKQREAVKEFGEKLYEKLESLALCFDRNPETDAGVYLYDVKHVIKEFCGEGDNES